MSDEMSDEMGDEFPEDDEDGGDEGGGDEGGGDEGGDEPEDDEGGDDEGGDEPEDEGGDEEDGDEEEEGDDEPEDEGGDEEDGDDEEEGDEEDGDDEEEGDEEDGDDDEGGGDEEDGDDEDGAEFDDAIDDDDDAFASADDFPEAEEEDFEDDEGDWSDDDYEESAQHLFADNQFLNEDPDARYLDEGYELVDEEYSEEFFSTLSQQIPSATDTIRIFQSNGAVKAVGFVSAAEWLHLLQLFPDLDTSELHLTIPARPEKKVKLKPLKAKGKAKDAVDLRKFATPIGDQKQTSRCSAFAWTHALEMAAKIQKKDFPRLSPSWTMLQFQKMQGDFKDHAWAASGGEGTVGGPKPGEVLIKSGTCRQDLWPDDDEAPRGSDADMTRDATRYKLGAKLVPIAAKDLKKALSAGHPVHVGMNTGAAFSKVGRDGIFKVSEKPSGQHGRHAMLIVGYRGNYYIVKNSWGTGWGDQGYCYIAKKTLEESEPNLVAIMVAKKGK